MEVINKVISNNHVCQNEYDPSLTPRIRKRSNSCNKSHDQRITKWKVTKRADAVAGVMLLSHVLCNVDILTRLLLTYGTVPSTSVKGNGNTCIV